MIKHFTITVSGRVQGVFFRATTKEQADKHEIKGFVRNEPDGSVYIEAEGEADRLKIFIKWCQHGPRMAIVNHFEMTESSIKGFDKFTISA